MEKKIQPVQNRNARTKVCKKTKIGFVLSFAAEDHGGADNDGEEHIANGDIGRCRQRSQQAMAWRIVGKGRGWLGWTWAEEHR